jgi:phospholipid transport system substrate-binding protein
MLSLAVSPPPPHPTPEQRRTLEDQFKLLLVRTYSGALSQVSDESVTVKPLRGSPADNDVVVRSEIRGRGDPIQLEYRLEKTPGEGAGWKIYNLNVLGVWLVETYRSQFAQEINSKGVDGLIATLVERNRSNAAGTPMAGRKS